jgi:ubiquinol-cytochrome c reductase cytochrome b subunit
MIAKRLARGIDDRLGTSRAGRSALNKVFPDHWSFLLGEVALYSFMVLVVTGVFLTFFFEPDLKQVVYHGSYAPLDGTSMSAAYRSTVNLSFDVRAGLVMRQMHHWAALVFLAAIVVHLCRIFFTGAFRRPREINWVVGVTMLLLALGNGFAGYSLPDDLLSGTGLRIAYSVVLAIPVIGTWLAFLVFGGPYPSDQIVGRLYIIHVLLIPAALAILMSVHLAVVWRQKHTQFPGPGRREDNVVGTRLWPAYAAKSVGLLFLVAGVVAALGGIAQINPVWLWGPYQPAAVTTAAQPDWYVGFLEGSLRLAPPWDLTLWGHTVPELFVPGVLLPGLTFALLYAWPWIERRFTHDHDDHNLLDRPRDRPLRTAIGVGVLTFYVVLTVAGGQDIIGQHLHVPIDEVTWFLRVALLVVPLAAGGLAYRVCRDLAEGDARQEDDARTDGPAPTPAGGGAGSPTPVDVEVGPDGSPEASHAAKAPAPTTRAAPPP